MKDGSTHMAHKAEHAVDLSTGALLAVTLQGADQGDTTTIHQTLAEAGDAVAELIEHEAETKPTEEPKVSLSGIEEVVADKGYHSGAVLQNLNESGCRTYIPEPARGRRKWEGKADERKQVYANRRRARGKRSKRLQRKRSELTERSMAHMYETGGMRRVHLKKRDNILKRLLVHAGGFNLALMMRNLIGIGKPRRLQGAFAGILTGIGLLISCAWSLLRQTLPFFVPCQEPPVTFAPPVTLIHQVFVCAFSVGPLSENMIFTSGC
jgi:transposase